MLTQTAIQMLGQYLQLIYRTTIIAKKTIEQQLPLFLSTCEQYNQKNYNPILAVVWRPSLRLD